MDGDEALCPGDYWQRRRVGMITLITGAPGSGKSAALVKLLQELAQGRTLYVDGIPDLKVDHQPLTDPRRWHLDVPDGAAVVIDEVQRVWRPAGPGAKVSDDIAALETHRHRGLDFFLVTQGPNLVHRNVRALVGRHVHLRDLGVLGRWWYEWPECSENLAWKSAPIKKRYRLPKKVFDLYKSSSLHVKPIRSFPWALAVMVGALVVTGVLTWKAYGGITDRLSGSTLGAVPGHAAVGAAPMSNVGQVAAAAPKPITGADIAMSFTPRLSYAPETAPAYDDLRQVINLPRIVGGVCMSGTCRCYTQQGTDARISSSECAQWIANPPFDPYTKQEAPKPQERPQAAVQAPGGSAVQPPSVHAPDEPSAASPLSSGEASLQRGTISVNELLPLSQARL